MSVNMVILDFVTQLIERILPLVVGVLLMVVVFTAFPDDIIPVGLAESARRRNFNVSCQLLIISLLNLVVIIHFQVI